MILDLDQQRLMEVLAGGSAASKMVDKLINNRFGVYKAVVLKPSGADFWVTHTGEFQTEPLKNVTGSTIKTGDKVFVTFVSNPGDQELVGPGDGFITGIQQ